MQARDRLIGMARQDPNLALVRPNGLSDNATYKIDIDRGEGQRTRRQPERRRPDLFDCVGLEVRQQLLDTDGRIKKVYVQADAPFRMNPEDLRSLYIRTQQGAWLPFTSFASGAWSYGSPKLERYNGVSSVEIQGQQPSARARARRWR